MDRVEYEKLIIQDLLNLEKNKELNLTPWYQRRSVWTQPQKAYLINTIFEKKPIPSIYIRHSLDIEAEKSIREVVDGQQRIKAIIEFTKDEFSIKHPNYSKRVKYSQLKKSEIESFKLSSLSVGYLLGATDEDVIEIFGRMNSVAKSLNDQEKRNAKFSGEYKQFCLSQAAKRLAVWRDNNIFSSSNIARMDEVKFISDLSLNFLKGLSDYSAAKLNKIYKYYDESFNEQKDLENRMNNVFNQIVGLKKDCIKNTVFSRPPLFFSLCIIIDEALRENRKLTATRIESALYRIDEILNSDMPISERPQKEAEFIQACSATTQRIKQRKTRHQFIKKQLGL